MTRIVRFSGPSNSGKTTRAVALIEELVARGERVAAIKHTHHPLNEENRGDTAKFRAAGANPVILAGNEEAVVFANDRLERVRYASLPDLVARLAGADVVIVEGFKTST